MTRCILILDTLKSMKYSIHALLQGKMHSSAVCGQTISKNHLVKQQQAKEKLAQDDGREVGRDQES